MDGLLLSAAAASSLSLIRIFALVSVNPTLSWSSSSSSSKIIHYWALLDSEFHCFEGIYLNMVLSLQRSWVCTLGARKVSNCLSKNCQRKLGNGDRTTSGNLIPLWTTKQAYSPPQEKNSNVALFHSRQKGGKIPNKKLFDLRIKNTRAPFLLEFWTQISLLQNPTKSWLLSSRCCQDCLVGWGQGCYHFKLLK